MDLFSIEWNSIKPGGPAHGIVTKGLGLSVVCRVFVVTELL